MDAAPARVCKRAHVERDDVHFPINSYTMWICGAPMSDTDTSGIARTSEQNCNVTLQ